MSVLRYEQDHSLREFDSLERLHSQGSSTAGLLSTADPPKGFGENSGARYVLLPQPEDVLEIWQDTNSSTHVHALEALAGALGWLSRPNSGLPPASRTIRDRTPFF